MKKNLTLTIILCFLTLMSFSQVPTLSAGLTSLTMNKGTIDVQVLTELITEKRNELQKEALRRFIFGLFPETNYTTRFYVQNCLNVLLNEKNPEVIKKEVFELTTNYALAIGVAKTLVATKNEHIINLDKSFRDYQKYSLDYRADLIKELKADDAKTAKTDGLVTAINNLENEIQGQIKIIQESEDVTTVLKAKRLLDTLENTRQKLQRRVERRKIRYDIPPQKYELGDKNDQPNVLIVPFGIVLDLVSSSLSEIEELKRLGFYRTPIRYESDAFYRSIEINKADTDEGRGKAKADLKVKLDKAKREIGLLIKQYITNYDLIKEFYEQKLERDTTNSINSKLIHTYSASIIDLVSNLALSRQLNINDSPNLKEFFEPINQYAGYLDFIVSLKTSFPKFKEISDSYKNELAKQNSLLKQLDSLNKANIVTQADSPKVVEISDKINALTSSISRFKSNFDFLLQAIDAKKKVQMIPVDKKAPDDIKLMVKEITDELKNFSQLTVDSALNFNFVLQADKYQGQVKKAIDDMVKKLTESGELFDDILKNVRANFTDLNKLILKNKLPNEIANAKLDDYTTLLSKIHQHLELLSKQKDIRLKDIKFMDDEVIPQLIKYGVLFAGDSAVRTQIQDVRLLSQLQKIKAVRTITVAYQKEFIDLFAFIKDLDKLDQAQTYDEMLNLLQSADSCVVNNLKDGKFRNVYIMFSNAVQKYSVTNAEEKYVELDVVSFLTDLQQYFDRNDNSRWGLYLNLGLNQNAFFGNPILPGATESIKFIGFASEKIGVKYKLANFNKLRGYENTVKNDVSLNKRAAFINQLYLIGYGSGLLYNIANTTTANEFKYAHVGFGTGIRFYNALDVNLIVGFPFVKGQPFGRFAFYGLGLDIPLGEYLEKLKK